MEAHLLFEKNNEYNNSLLILHVIDYQREKERRTTSNTVNEQFKVVCVCVCVLMLTMELHQLIEHQICPCLEQQSNSHTWPISHTQI
jgi:hypothetical protein